MRNVNSPLTNRMCCPTMFENKEDANKNVSVFEFFNCPVTILNKIDHRRSEDKMIIRKYGYFHADILVQLSKIK